MLAFVVYGMIKGVAFLVSFKRRLTTLLYS